MIDATQLTKAFGKKLAVDRLSFTVKSGMVTGFLGPNGAGKSTTMRLILGLDRPTSGQARVNGRAYTHTKAPMTEVGALLEAKSVHPGRTARSHLRALAVTHGISKKRVDEVIESVGLSQVANKRAGGFSLGMSQRLGLAAALLGDPETLILDEPINGLDPEGVAWVRTLVKQLAQEGRTIFISSHLMSEMALTADHVIIIGRGRMIADSPMSDLIERASGHVVKVRSPNLSDIVDVVTESGREVTHEEDGSILISGLTSEAVGKEAERRGWVLYELTPVQRSLEDVYMELTAAAQEFHSHSQPVENTPVSVHPAPAVSAPPVVPEPQPQPQVVSLPEPEPEPDWTPMPPVRTTADDQETQLMDLSDTDLPGRAAPRAPIRPRPVTQARRVAPYGDNPQLADDTPEQGSTPNTGKHFFSSTIQPPPVPSHSLGERRRDSSPAPDASPSSPAVRPRASLGIQVPGTTDYPEPRIRPDIQSPARTATAYSAPAPATPARIAPTQTGARTPSPARAVFPTRAASAVPGRTSAASETAPAPAASRTPFPSRADAPQVPPRVDAPSRPIPRRVSSGGTAPARGESASARGESASDLLRRPRGIPLPAFTPVPTPPDDEDVDHPSLSPTGEVPAPQTGPAPYKEWDE